MLKSSRFRNDPAERHRREAARRGRVHMAVLGDILLVLSAGVAALLVSRLAAGHFACSGLC